MAKKRIIELVISDYTFSLKNLKVHADMSEETTCFSADLVCNGKVIAHCKNDGHGGCTDVYNYHDDPNRELFWKALQDIRTVHDKEYEDEVHSQLSQYSWFDPSTPTEQLFTPEHLADRLVYKQSVWDDVVKQIKRMLRKRPLTSQVWFNGSELRFIGRGKFAPLPGFEDVTQWVM